MNNKKSLFPINWTDYFSLYFLSASVILWEILLTRIYSVIMFYHFAFMVVSIAMFGLTAGATLVFFLPKPTSKDERKQQLGNLIYLSGILMLLSICIQLNLRPVMDSSLKSILYFFQIYVISAIPLIPAGAAICIVLTEFEPVHRLYFSDLAGAASGCFIIPLFLKYFGGPGAVLATAAILCIAALLQVLHKSKLFLLFSITAICFSIFAIGNNSFQWVRIQPPQINANENILFESWNAFSRIVVKPFSNELYSPGIHPFNLRKASPIEQKVLVIDSSASTLLTKFENNLEPFEILKLDQSTLAHQLRPGSKVIIIGPGGGRDILGALVMGQQEIHGVEINPNILEAVNGKFGEFTGHLDQHPKVRFFTEDGRSYLSRKNERFDVIQASLVDTIAATAAGAFAFTENGLFTTQAWTLFLNRLNPRGILCFSRWYYGSTTWPVEVYRTIGLAAAALRSLGIADPGKHIIVVHSNNVVQSEGKKIAEGLATIMLSPDPFSNEDIQKIQNLNKEMNCVLAWPSTPPSDPNIEPIIYSTPSALREMLPLDISPPTDDRPYFFFHTRLMDVILNKKFKEFGFSSFNLSAVRHLVALCFITITLGLILTLIPLIFTKKSRQQLGVDNFLLFPFYFAMIGLGFMFFEIGLIQRLSLYLGHPTYGFTVVLAGLLLASGLGSLVSERMMNWNCKGHFIFVLIIAAIVMAEYFGLLLIERTNGKFTLLRIVFSLLMIAPPAFFMGFAFPIGMKEAQKKLDRWTAWYWAINGSFSVIASVLAMIVSISSGIRMTMWWGACFYGFAGLVIWRIQHQSVHDPKSTATNPI